CTQYTTRRVVDRLHERGAGGRVGVEERREEVFPAVRAVRVVAGAGGLVHQQRAGVARVRALAVHARARRRGLQRRAALPLVEPVAERVGHRAGHHAGHVDHHPVHAHVAAGWHQRRRLGTVHRLVERPRALPRALRRRVAHPREREDEVGDDGLLRRREPAVPEDRHGDVAAQHGAIVVRELVRLGLDQRHQLPIRHRRHSQSCDDEHHCKQQALLLRHPGKKSSD
ncbi:Os06g0220100, partial [Oryza sativa Japonica Group]